MDLDETAAHGGGVGPPPARPDGRAVLPSFLGAGLLACAVFVVLAGATLVPWWVTVPAAVGLLLCLGVTVVWFVRRPPLVLAAPVGLLLVWFLALLAVT